MSTFVLVHSPLVGPFTWSLVADELGPRGVSVAFPTLPEDERERYWRMQAEAVAAHVAEAGGPLVLVDHSGACPLLPAIGTAIDGTVSVRAYLDCSRDVTCAAERLGVHPISPLAGLR